MEWEQYLAGLSAEDRARSEGLAGEHGVEAARRHVRYHPVQAVAELEQALKRESQRVRGPVPGLYESIDVHRDPPGWQRRDRPIETEVDGTTVLHSDVLGPNGTRGVFERAFHPGVRRVELRYAFLLLGGANEGLPAWVSGMGVPLVPGRGTPTVQYFTLCQLKLLGVPAGRRPWWGRLMYRSGLRAGPFAQSGALRTIRMRQIQNIDTIIHLQWMRERHPGAPLGGLIAHTASVGYGETTATLCEYRVEQRSVIGGDLAPIGTLLAFQEQGNALRAAKHDDLLRRFGYLRSTRMLMNFDIDLAVVPL